MRRGLMLFVALAGAVAAVAYVVLRDPRPETPQGTWEPVDHASST